jgi:hypothetical protein
MPTRYRGEPQVYFARAGPESKALAHVRGRWTLEHEDEGVSGQISAP